MSADTEADATPSFDSTADTYDSICVGDRVTATKTITDADVSAFATVSGDSNPLHLDDEYATDTRFEDRIAHGVLVAGVISAAIAQLPGVVVYLSQDMQFLAPVYINDDVTATVELAEELGDNRYSLTTEVTNNTTGNTVITGCASVLIEPEP